MKHLIIVVFTESINSILLSKVVFISVQTSMYMYISVVKHSIIVVFTDTFLCMKMLLEQLHNSKYVVKHSIMVVFTDMKSLESSMLLIDSVANQECQSQMTQSQITHAVAHSCCKHPICAREQPETVTLHASSLRKPY